MSLQLRNVQKAYREPGGTTLPVLDVSQFDIAAGEQVALVGQSGGGKTTLLNVIAGITQVDSGQVIVDGVDIVIDFPSGQVREFDGDPYDFRFDIVAAHLDQVTS